MLLVTTDTIPGKNLEMLGLVTSNVVRAKHIGKAFLANMRAIGGGEIPEYTELMYETRRVAIDRVINVAKHMGADAIVSVKFDACSVMDGSSEVMVYGTAVKYLN